MFEDRGMHNGNGKIIDERAQILEEIKRLSSVDSDAESNDFTRFQRTEARWECGLQCLMLKFSLSDGLLVIDSIEDKDVKIKLIKGILNSSFDNPEVYKFFKERFKEYEEYFPVR